MQTPFQDQSNSLAAAIDAVRKQPFTYGFELHLASDNAAITFDPQTKAFFLVYDVSRMEDAHWKGDCSTDSALTYNKLSGAATRSNITLQKVDWQFSEFYTALNHVRVVVGNGEVVEHPTFYSTLDTSRATINIIQVRTGQAVAPSYLKPAAGLNYKDFMVGDSSFLVVAHVERDVFGLATPTSTTLPAATICIKVFKQQHGQLCQMIQKSIGLPPGELSDAQVDEKISDWTSKSPLVNSLNSEVTDPPDAMVINELDKAFKQTIKAFKLGQSPTEVNRILAPLVRTMKANPTGWFLKR